MNILRIGHRGACGYEPENTLRSFRKALDLGVDMVELDVHPCKTGELIVIHDDKVDRTTDGSGLVTDKELQELKSLEVGKGERIPTLQEVIDLVKGKTKIDIEIKAPDVEERVVRILEKNNMVDEVLVSSFIHPWIKKVKEINPKIKTGALITRVTVNLIREVLEAKADVLVLNFKCATKEIVEDAHNHKLAVYVWTVDDKEDILRMKELNVDGIASNFPDRI